VVSASRAPTVRLRARPEPMAATAVTVAPVAPVALVVVAVSVALVEPVA